ncbi:hypothetical protein PG993_010864 [Apiospora rasikravindrae]|uniref:2EXR domain-containing protein n=1 Tax=Apiospora rasikravindrae TaxID=990691 RepID=A0ABR1SCM3_9PEZI
MASSFHSFPRLPMELQEMVWQQAVLADHHYILIDAASHFAHGPRRAAMGITPTPNLRRALLEVNRVSRTLALRHCPVCLDVWERPPHMLEDDDDRASRAGLDMTAAERRRELRLYEAQDRAQDLAERMLDRGETLTAAEQQLVYDNLGPRAQQIATAATADYLGALRQWTSATGPTDAAFSAGVRQAIQRQSMGKGHIWARSSRPYEDRPVPTTRRGVVYLDPARDYFVTFKFLTKAKRDALCAPLRRAQRFIALSRDDFPGDNNTSTLYHAGAPSKALTPPTSLRRLARRGLEMHPNYALPPSCRPDLWQIDQYLGRRRALDYFYANLSQDLYELDYCHRAFTDFDAGEHAAVLGHLCAGRDLAAPEVWGPRVLGGYLPLHLRVSPGQRPSGW